MMVIKLGNGVQEQGKGFRDAGLRNYRRKCERGFWDWKHGPDSMKHDSESVGEGSETEKLSSENPGGSETGLPGPEKNSWIIMGQHSKGSEKRGTLMCRPLGLCSVSACSLLPWQRTLFTSSSMLHSSQQRCTCRDTITTDTHQQCDYELITDAHLLKQLHKALSVTAVCYCPAWCLCIGLPGLFSRFMLDCFSLCLL